MSGTGDQIFTPNLIFSFDLKPHAKFGNPTIPPSGRKATQQKREREREKKGERKTQLIVDT
jgi:hypothetical protein